MPRKKTHKIKTTCFGCGGVFTFYKEHAQLLHDFRDGDAYVAPCPTCKKDKWVSVKVFK